MFFRRSLRCSFCRKTEHEVAKLVAGPRVYICDTCVRVAIQFMEDDADAPPPAPVELSIWRRLWLGVQKRFRGGAARFSGHQESLAACD